MAARKWETGESSPRRRQLERCVKAACQTTGAMSLALAQGRFEPDDLAKWAAGLRLVADALCREVDQAPEPAQRASVRLGTEGSWEEAETPLE